MDVVIRTEPTTEHAVVVSLRMSHDDPEAHDRITDLTAQIALSLEKVTGGEFGGSDSNGGYCLLYCYGNNAGEVFDAIGPDLEKFNAEPGSWVIKRFGAATDQYAVRERVDLA